VRERERDRKCAVLYRESMRGGMENSKVVKMSAVLRGREWRGDEGGEMKRGGMRSGVGCR